MKLHLLGTRGSMPTGGKDYIKYGSDTSSYLIESGGELIFLDAGSGICHAPLIEKKRVSIFISHMHLDHILGMPFFPYLFRDVDIDIYAAMPKIEIKSIVDRLFSNPFWPCTLDNYTANINYKTISNEIMIGETKVSAIKGNHPGGSFIYQVEREGKSVCYVTDYEHSEATDERLIPFIKDTDLVIYDGQYTKDEYETHKGFGHSTKEKGVELCDKANAKKIVFTHHDPMHKDSFLDMEASRLSVISSNFDLARQGEVISL